MANNATKFCNGNNPMRPVTVTGTVVVKGVETPILSHQARLNEVVGGYRHAPGFYHFTTSKNGNGVDSCVKCGSPV